MSFDNSELQAISDCLLDIILDIEEQEDILEEEQEYCTELIALKIKIDEMMRGEIKEVLH